MGIGMKKQIFLSVIASILILAFPLASGHGNIDQSFPGPCTGGGLNVFAFGLAGQSFTPTATNLVAVDLIINTGATPTTYTLNIRSGSITGTIIGTSSTVIASTGDGPLEHFDFPTIVPLIPGNLFVIEVTGSGTGFWCTSTANPYAGGTAILDGKILTNRDMGFTTFFSDPPIGGTLVPIDTTSLLLVGAQSTAAWMIPVIIAGIGIAIVIARRF